MTTEDREHLLSMLEAIDPAGLNYTEWTQVGMALKHEGLTAYDWDQWSARDASRYKPGECYKKWESFNEGAGRIVTGGTLCRMAQDHGWGAPSEDDALEWDAAVYADHRHRDDQKIIDTRWVEGQELNEPGKNWDGVADLIKYLETLFQMDEYVGTVTTSYETEDGRRVPTKGSYTQTAGEIIQQLKKTRDIGAVIGDPHPDAGAWIRFNPLDGKGCKNENVSEYRFALVESDTQEIEKQNAIIRELELPVACLVYSGKKSIHAIIKVDASNYEEYRNRVDYLYTICKKNGLNIDTQNRNPSRLSRMPGVMRGNKKQFLIDTNIGKKDWQEWREFIEAANDDMPDPEGLADVWDNLPELAPPLIDGVLRQGHKMLIAGPSKAGKSFALIELCCAIAEGRNWFGWNCSQGRVLYVNLEVDRASCLHRFKEVYQGLKWKPEHLKNIDIWNLRGSSVPMDKLAPRLIRRASKKNYITVIIDPIYKVITGDENSADAMAYFCNQFDKIAKELNCSVIYCHHHSKGSQGEKKSADRASGSGVFARDTDALIDIIELEQTPSTTRARRNYSDAVASIKWLDSHRPTWQTDWPLSEEQKKDGHIMRELVLGWISKQEQRDYLETIEKAWDQMKGATPWRVEGTLREFQTFEPKDIWFQYPIHIEDNTGLLEQMEPEGMKAPWQKAAESRKDPETKQQRRNKELEEAFAICNVDGQEVTLQDLADTLEVKSVNTVKNRVNEHPGFELVTTNKKKGGNGPTLVRRKEPEKPPTIYDII